MPTCVNDNKQCGKICIKKDWNCNTPPNNTPKKCTRGKSKHCGQACIPSGKKCHIKGEEAQEAPPQAWVNVVNAVDAGEEVQPNDILALENVTIPESVKSLKTMPPAELDMTDDSTIATLSCGG